MKWRELFVNWGRNGESIQRDETRQRKEGTKTWLYHTNANIVTIGTRQKKECMRYRKRVHFSINCFFSSCFAHAPRFQLAINYWARRSMPALGTMMNFVFIYLWGFHSFLNEYDYCRIMCHDSPSYTQPYFNIHSSVCCYDFIYLIIK